MLQNLPLLRGGVIAAVQMAADGRVSGVFSMKTCA